jgi:hypothetical protein
MSVCMIWMRLTSNAPISWFPHYNVLSCGQRLELIIQKIIRGKGVYIYINETRTKICPLEFFNKYIAERPSISGPFWLPTPQFHDFLITMFWAAANDAAPILKEYDL